MADSNAQAAIQQAIHLHQQGRLEEAGRLYRAVLQLQPDNFDALHLMGVMLAQQGNSAAAVEAISRALGHNPASPEGHFNLGNVLLALRRHDEALASYDRALALQSGNAEAHYQRGNVLRALHRPVEALASFEAAIALKPDHVEACFARGNALKTLNHLDEAVVAYDRLLELRPEHAEALYNRGNALMELARFEAALASFDGAVAARPGYAEAHVNRGNALEALRRFEESLASYERAIAIKPDFPDALNNRGNALFNLDRVEEALASHEAGLAINPNHLEALINRGNALRALRRFEDSLASLDQALRLRPDSAEALSNRGNVLQDLERHEEAIACYGRAVAVRPGYAAGFYNRGNALANLNRRDEAIASYDQVLAIDPDYKYALAAAASCRAYICDWRGLDLMQQRLVEGVRAGEALCEPLPFLAISSRPADQRACATAYARDKHPAVRPPLWRGERYGHDRIRVAYLSADFREHAVAYLVAGLFEQHDRMRFETFGISFGPDDRSDMHDRLVKGFDRFIDVRARSDAEVARLLRDAEIDIAVDLMGFTRNCRTRILARRAAPVQVNYLGCAATMGAGYIDYVIADACIIPPGQQIHFSEEVVTLPGCFQVNDSKRRIAERIPTRAEAGLPERGFVFCCFNNSYKFTPGVFDIWMRLLDAVPHSVLWLPQAGAAADANLRREAAGRGVDPDRLIFAPRLLAYSDHLARVQLADLFLDTLPYNAHTTASDALWAGVPVLTCTGEAYASRVAASLLAAVGLPELVTHDLADYEALALKLATQHDVLWELRERLARNRLDAPLFDTGRFRRNIESAYTTMREISERGEEPRAFAVNE